MPFAAWQKGRGVRLARRQSKSFWEGKMRSGEERKTVTGGVAGGFCSCATQSSTSGINIAAKLPWKGGEGRGTVAWEILLIL